MASHRPVFPEIPELPQLERVYDTPLKGTEKRFYTFEVPTEVVIGRRTPTTDWAHRPISLTPIQGREYETVFVLRPDGGIEPWWVQNDGQGKQIICQEVFEDRGDDGHTDFVLSGYRYVLAGHDPWARPNGFDAW